MKKYPLILATIFATLTAYTYSEETTKTKSEKEETTKKEPLIEERPMTSHSIVIDGKDVSYTATAGTYIIRNEQETPRGTIFFIAYTKDKEENYQQRPITFCFNGGPGSSSVWLHLGILGPRRVFLSDRGYGLQPYHLVDNEYSLLDETDLVFIDPVSTGYSRAAPGEDPKQFHGVEEDIEAVAEFIRMYVTRNERWESPKFIAGESYGTTRAAGLAGHLHEKHRLFLDGIMLISSVLNFQTISFSQPGNDLPYVLFLPTYTATAWYYKKLPAPLQENFQKTLEFAQDFALNDYARALLLGDRLKKEERERIIHTLSDLTGLSPDYIDRSRLRINIFRFVKELLRDQKRTVGRFDSRFQGIDYDACGETFDYDPSLDSIIGAYTATFNDYIRRELGWKTDTEYAILTNVNPWNYASTATNQFLNVGETLRDVMTKNFNLGVFVASGYYDLATPYFATEYTFDHLGLDSSLKSHVTKKVYEGGHMMYNDRATLKEMKNDLKEFIHKNINKNEY